MKRLVGALGLVLAISGCKSDGSSKAEPTVFRAWTNSQSRDDNDVPCTGIMTLGNATASIQFTYKDYPNENYTCDCALDLTGNTNSGTIHVHSCTLRAPAQNRICNSIDFTNSFESDGLSYFQIGSQAVDLWTNAN